MHTRTTVEVGSLKERCLGTTLRQTLSWSKVLQSCRRLLVVCSVLWRTPIASGLCEWSQFEFELELEASATPTSARSSSSSSCSSSCSSSSSYDNYYCCCYCYFYCYMYRFIQRCEAEGGTLSLGGRAVVVRGVSCGVEWRAMKFLRKTAPYSTRWSWDSSLMTFVV